MISCNYLVLYKNKKRKKDRIIALRDTGGTISFGLRISFPTKDYKSKPTAKERNKLNARKWKERNPDKYQAHLEWVRQWRLKNKKKLIEYNQKWRDTHREEYRAQQREYYWRRKKKDTKGIK